MGFNKSSFPQAYPIGGVHGSHGGAGRIAANRLILIPFVVENITTFINYYYTISNIVTPSNVALHVFNDALTTRLYTSGSIPSVLSPPAIPISLILSRGLYYLGIQCDQADTRFSCAGGSRSPGIKALKLDGAAFPQNVPIVASDIAPFVQSGLNGNGIPNIGLSRY